MNPHLTTLTQQLVRKMAECLSDTDSFVEEIEPEVEAHDSTSSCSTVHVPSL